MLARLLVGTAEAVVHIATREVLAHRERLTPNLRFVTVPLDDIQPSDRQTERLGERFHKLWSARVYTAGLSNDMEELIQHLR